MHILTTLLLTLMLSMEMTMPVFANPNNRNAQPPRPPQPQQQGGVPAWLQGNVAAQSYMNGQGSSGTTVTTYGRRNQKRLRGAPVGQGGNLYIESPSAPMPQTVGGNMESKKILRGGGQNGPSLIYGDQAQTYVANPQTYTAPNRPAWLPQNTTGGVYLPGGLSPQQRDAASQQLAQQNDKPWRIQNPDGTFAYLQTDGTYLTATGTAGQDDIVPRNSYVTMPPFLQLQPPAAPPAGYSPFSSSYSGWGRGGRGGGGRGGYQQSPYVPSWMMGLNSWNFGE